jgi:hypothetical protein
MSLSKELQIGKAAEHLVCADLILQGHSAFLADQGLSYDVVLDTGIKLWRVQVKGCMAPSIVKVYGNSEGEYRYGRNNTYRFGTRRSKGNTRATDADLADIYAFVALDIKKIAYLPTSMITTGTVVVGCVEFRSRLFEYPGRTYSNGTVRKGSWGRYIEDYEKVTL